MSSKQFKRDFAAVLKRAGEKQELFLKKLGIEFAKRAIEKSPVDEGTFRGNWQFGVGAPDPKIDSEPDKKSGKTLLRITMQIQASSLLGQKYYITNNLPYAKRLEYGWSKQTPSGMVRVTLMELESYVRKAAAEVRGK